MLPAVEFQKQPPVEANEVNNVPTHGYLSPKLETHQSSVPESAPDEPLHVGLGFAKFADEVPMLVVIPPHP